MHPDSLRQLIANCRRKSTRGLGFPRDWNPGSVLDPMNPGHVFTDVGAWEFLADTLAAGHNFIEIPLQRPAGAQAIVIEVAMPNSQQPLYIKIEIGPCNKPLGRSFHYSDKFRGKS